jgi:hypothetical protein
MNCFYQKNSIEVRSLSTIQSFIFKIMLFREHTLVQDARNEDAVLFPPVKEDVPPFFKAMQIGPNPHATPTEARIGSQQLRAFLQAVKIAPRLSRTPVLQRVCANAQQVSLGATRISHRGRD